MPNTQKIKKQFAPRLPKGGRHMQGTIAPAAAHAASQGTTIESLPTELLLEIAQFLDFDSCKNLRPVTKKFNEVASQRVFEVFYAGPLFKSLENLTKIGGHPILGKCVKTLIYINFRLDDTYTDYQKWKKYALHVSTYKVPPRHDLRFHNFRYICEKQRQICYNRLDSNCLKECVKGLPNLETVRMLAHTSPEIRTESGKRPILDGVFFATLLKRPYIPASATASAFARPQAAIVEGFGIANRSVKRLEYGEMSFGFWENVDRPALFDTIGANIGAAFANLTRLSICTWMGDVQGVEFTIPPIDRVARFMSAAPALEILHLELLALKYRARKFEDLPAPDLTGMFATVTWRKLRVLQICDFDVNRVAFTRFLERHATCLECLRVRRVTLVEKHPDAARSLLPGKGKETGASWECAIRYLRPIMTGLQFVDFLMLNDAYLKRKYEELRDLHNDSNLHNGSNFPDTEDSDDSDDSGNESAASINPYMSWHWILGAYCREMAGHLLLGGDHTIPSLGRPKTLTCPACLADEYCTGHGSHSEPPYGDWDMEYETSPAEVDENGYIVNDQLDYAAYAEARSPPGSIGSSSDEEDVLGKHTGAGELGAPKNGTEVGEDGPANDVVEMDGAASVNITETQDTEGSG